MGPRLAKQLCSCRKLSTSRIDTGLPCQHPFTLQAPVLLLLCLQAKMTPKAFIHKIHEICRADLQNIVLPEVCRSVLGGAQQAQLHALLRGVAAHAGFM